MDCGYGLMKAYDRAIVRTLYIIYVFHFSTYMLLFNIVVLYFGYCVHDFVCLRVLTIAALA